MFGLLKLLAYGLLGYVLYEFIRGMYDAEGANRLSGPGGGMGGGSMGRGMGGGMGGGAGRLSGPGRGASVSTQEPGGGSMPRSVGRGAMG